MHTKLAAATRGASALPEPEKRAAEPLSVDLCIIGAGSGGLAVAAAAAAYGRKVVLIEKHKMGGNRLNYGCVPSKALRAAARRAHLMRTAGAFGITALEPEIDYAAVHNHVQSVVAAVAPNDSVERLTGLGVRVIQAAGRFADKRTVMAGDYRITARRFIIATGSSPVVPPTPGLENAPYFTSETIFDNARKLEHLVVIGAGPVGLELAQTHGRLGSRVTVLEAAEALPDADPELKAVVLARLRREGIDIREGATPERVETLRGGRVRLHASLGDRAETLDATHILLAAGRQPNVGDLNLDAAGIRFDKRGITVNSALRTSNGRVFAIGDVAGGPQFTHVSSHHADIVVRRVLFRLPAKVDPGIVPWIVFTDPELAHAGLSEKQAADARIAVNVLRWPYHENDRAQAERVAEGHIKVVTDKKGRILGATIVGHDAGELIQMWSLAISRGLGIKAMTEWISPYPTLGEIGKRAAGRAFAPANPRLRKLASFLSRLG